MERQSWKNTAILLLSIAMTIAVIIIIILLRSASGKGIIDTGKDVGSKQFAVPMIPPIGPVDEDTIRTNVNAFRQMPNGRDGSLPPGHGLWYTEGEIAYYVQTVFPRIKAAQIDYMLKNKKDTTGYDWNIGFYWMLNKDRDNLVKHDFCFAPVMVDRRTNKVVDFFGASDTYGRKLKILIPPRGGKGGGGEITTSVYNTGNMFP